jgi:AraC family transcriptional regulator
MPRQLEQRWIERTTEVLDFLSTRLDDPPSLEDLASVAGCSPFHFHRIWRVLLREPVRQTIARLRIAAAQQRLRDTGATITSVAMDGGFATPQSFARAFRRVTGLSPSEFVASDLPKFGVEPDGSAEVQVELRPACTLVALRREGGAYRELNAWFGRVWAWAQGSGRLGGLQGLYGLPLDDPFSVAEDQLRYDACLALGDGVEPPDPFHRVVLHGGQYARLRHSGSYDGLEETNQKLVEWMIASGHMPANQPLVHQFLDDHDETAAESLRTDVLLLLEPMEDSK